MNKLVINDDEFEVVDAAARTDLANTNVDLATQKARIDEIYVQLDRAERAELLAAAERILEKRPNNKK